MIHIGLVGLGKIGMRHLEAYKQVQGANVSGIYDIDNAHAQQCCRDFNVDWQKGMQHSPRISYYPSYKSLLEDEDIDVIDICTPTPTHHQLILDALNHDKHVFCEKPLTHRLVYAQEIERRANKVGRLVSVGYLYRFHPSFQLLKQLLNDNILGDPYFAILRIGGRGGWRLWKHQRAFAGGAILEMMVHMLDLAYYWFGEYVAYHVHRATLLPQRKIAGQRVHVDAEDLVLFRLKTVENKHFEKNGVEIYCQADLVSPSYMNYVEMHGTNGSYYGSILEELPTMIYCKQARGEYKQGKSVIHYPQTDLVQMELQHFVAALQGSQEPINCVSDSVKVLKAMEDVVVSGNIQDMMRTHGTELLPPLEEQAIQLECPQCGHKWQNPPGAMWRCPNCAAYSGVKPIQK